MSSATECGGCHSPTGDGARLCTACTARLRGYLATVPELVADLDVTRTKQDRIGGGEPRVTGTVEKPLGFRPAALDAAYLLETTLAYWVLNILGPDHFVMGYTNRSLRGSDVAVECAATMLTNIEQVRQHDDAATALSEIMYATGRARAAVDRPPGRSYAGPCDCGVDLYAKVGAAAIVCRNCRTRFSMEARRAWLLESLRDHVATAAEIAHGIGELHGQQINRKTVNQWHHRERLTPAGFTPGGEPMFRIGDVLDLAVSNSEKKAAPT